MLLTIALMCLVASAERSARRCTSSATTVKPRPASPAEAAWIAAFSASTLVCSVMSEMSCTISPISWELSPSRLMRLEVSWICSRMSFMPRIAFCTATAPFSAALSEDCATLTDSPARWDTWVIDCAMLTTDWPVPWISLACRCAACSSCAEVACASAVAVVTCCAAALMPVTRRRSSSTVKLMESAMAPVISSVTRARAQVAVGEAADLVEQPQDGRLVAAVLPLALDRPAAAVGKVHLAEQQQAAECEQREQYRGPGVRRLPLRRLLVQAADLHGRLEQPFAGVEDVAARLLGSGERLHLADDRLHRLGERRHQLAQFLGAPAHRLVGDRGNARHLGFAGQRVHYAEVLVGVVAQQPRDLGVGPVGGQQPHGVDEVEIRDVLVELLAECHHRIG